MSRTSVSLLDPSNKGCCIVRISLWWIFEARQNGLLGSANFFMALFCILLSSVFVPRIPIQSTCVDRQTRASRPQKKFIYFSFFYSISAVVHIPIFFNYFQVLSKRYVKKNVFYFLKIKTQQLMLNFVLIFLTDQAIGCLLDTTQVMLIQPTYDQICTMLMQVP